MNKYKNIAIKIFLNLNQYDQNDILKIKKIHIGYTNKSFLIMTKDNCKYQIRIGCNNNIVDRNNEYNILKLLNDKNYLYYNKSNGNAIKKWIDGSTLKYKQIKNSNILLALINKINEFHNIKINSNSNLLMHNYMYYIDKSKLNKCHLSLYKKLVEKISTNDYVLSHNDLNLKNIIIDNNSNIHLIDYEWSRINHKYWDIAYFIKETNTKINFIKKISKLANIDLKTLIEFVYITINFSYQWTFNNSFSFKILTYRLKMRLKMHLFLKYLK